MPITRLSLKNYTAFKELDASFSNGINVFIGDNGTGKTHLLKALFAFCECDKTPYTLSTNNREITENPDSSISKSTVPFVHDSFIDKLARYFLADDVRMLYHDSQYEPSFIIKYNDYQDDNIQFQFFAGLCAQALEQADLLLLNPNNIKSAFIPAKEMLTHARIEKDYAVRKVPFDETLIDIINKSGASELRDLAVNSQNILGLIESIIHGKVFYDRDIYYISRKNVNYNFQVEAEGYKKFAVLLRLLETGALTNGSILFWDEPEANMNPHNIPTLVDILIALREMDVQIFIATHDYLLAKYLEVRNIHNSGLLFHALYRNNGDINLESGESFTTLKNNGIVEQTISLYEEEVAKVLG